MPVGKGAPTSALLSAGRRRKRRTKLTVPNLLPPHQRNVDAPGTRHGGEGDQLAQQSFRGGLQTAQARDQSREADSDGARGDGSRNVGCSECGALVGGTRAWNGVKKRTGCGKRDVSERGDEGAARDLQAISELLISIDLLALE